jgi:hypothetical protein
MKTVVKQRFAEIMRDDNDYSVPHKALLAEKR